jgi:apolipoprotein N-acyltransferase
MVRALARPHYSAMAALTSFLWLLSAVALLVLSMRTSAMPVAAWLSLTLLLRGARAAGPGGVVYAVVALYAGMAVGMRGVIPIAGPPFYAVAGVIALSLAMPLVADRLVGPRIAGAWSTLVFPMAWVAIEFAQARVGGYGTNGSIAYTQSGNLPLVQLAAVTGIWGITFLIAWFASIVNWSWERQID